MESNLRKSPKLGHPADSSDAKYISGLSTILVATIQEAKDRISQIEYIFCSQLFPNFQSLQQIYSEAKEAAEDAYKEKEKDLQLQIKRLQGEKQQVLEENQLLKLENAKFISMETQSCNRVKELQQELKQKTLEVNEGRKVHENLQKLLESKSSLIHSYEMTIKELEEKSIMLQKIPKKLEVETEELRQELMKKSKEVDELMELQNKLLQLNQSKACLIVQKENQLKEYEEKTKGLISNLENMESKVNALQSGLGDKTEEVDKGKELQANLLKKIEFQASEIMYNEQLLTKYETENKLLAAKVKSRGSDVEALQKELVKKTCELEEVRKVQQQLLQQSNSYNFDRIKRGQALEEFEEERKQLVDKQKGLKEKVDKLQKSLSERTQESSEGMELHGKLLQQIEVKDSELLSEKRKKRDVIAAYKRLKSQYNYLLKKYAQETGLPLDKMEDESEIIRANQTPITSCDIENNTLKASGEASGVTKPVDEQEALEDKKGGGFIQRSGPVSPSTSSIVVPPKCPTSSKSCPPAGAKRPISYWRDTRAHQSRVGPDPHDDFLDTPLENVRENLGKVMKEDPTNSPKLVPVNMRLDNSDDETQDMDADGGPEKPNTSTKAGTLGFKYVESVRKKSERESLKGVECKQCKKFYDVVLPGAGNNSNNDKQNIRCEHHNGVSRHRYRKTTNDCRHTREGTEEAFNIKIEKDQPLYSQTVHAPMHTYLPVSIYLYILCIHTHSHGDDAHK
ncbi:protein gamma response 1 isoform X1 [Sesamum indicum]|uniref:Protein gamma response 1 isoform X1 n=1 Tax=Sesamum indicum TaxID=4182 RepID=A0A6I9U0Q3_SESIN|nr:protein gamma response 1 isoform X1 [Sesamum indicum]